MTGAACGPARGPRVRRTQRRRLLRHPHASPCCRHSCSASRRSPSMSATGTSNGQQAQRAADAAALAGVPNLPGDPEPRRLDSARNSPQPTVSTTPTPTIVVTGGGRRDAHPAAGHVTKTVNNVVRRPVRHPDRPRSAAPVADFAGPVPHGQPLQRVRQRPRGPTQRRQERALLRHRPVLGQRRKSCRTQAQRRRVPEQRVYSGDDGCTGTTNDDYDPNGYFYTV